MTDKVTLKKMILDRLKSVCDNVDSTFIEPQTAFESCGEYPAIFIKEVSSSPDIETTRRLILSFSIFGVVSGEREVLSELRDLFETKVFNALFSRTEKLGLNLVYVDSNNDSIDPGSLEAGVAFPKAIFRMDVQAPFVR